MKQCHIMPMIAVLSACLTGPVTGFAQDGGGDSRSSLTASPSSLTFSAVQNGAAPPSQSLTVSGGRYSYTASVSVQNGGRNWLAISPAGTVPISQRLTVSVIPAGLAPGTYNWTVSISSGRSSDTVPVTLRITAPTLTISPTALTFNGTVNQSAPAAQTLSVTATSATSFTASASVQNGGRNWLSISPSGALTTNRNLTASVSLSGLAAGTYNGTIALVANGTTRTVPVTLNVAAGTSTFSFSPTSLTFSGTLNQSAPLPQTLSVTATRATSFTASASVQNGGTNWLAISPSGTLTTNQNLTVSVSLSGLVAGTFNGTITLVANGTTRTVPVTFNVSSGGGGGGTTTGFKLIGWNDLGMHCFDGADYSVFAVLPPYNTIHAHLLDSTGTLVVSPTGYSVTYEAIADPLTNTINTTSIGKTNFWTYVSWLFGAMAPDMGLKGNAMPGAGNTPRAMGFSATDNTFLAEGIPITPFPDSGAARNYFPMMRLTAKNASGAVLATTDIVVPTSDEMTCSVCHGSNSGYGAAMPAGGWANNSDLAKDVKFNILRKHDDRFKGNALFQSASAALGYSASGLEATVASRPILCGTCHGTNALGLSGIANVPALTTAMHSLHASVTDPATGQSLGSGTTRDSCYHCHPGPKTQCLRGTMATMKTGTGANAMECQSCHGSLSTVANASRKGWLDEPTCQSCHGGTATSNSGQIVYTSVFSSGTTMRVAADQTFATNANTPSAGLSLYRFSKGHGGLQCEACHGSTHAEYITAVTNDNVQSTNLQGHAGTLAECSACHGATVPTTTNGGPHGLHPIGSTWVSRHPNVAEGNATQCQPCHGTDYRGTVLSKTQADRTLAGRSFPRGTVIGCYSCHNGPNGG